MKNDRRSSLHIGRKKNRITDSTRTSARISRSGLFGGGNVLEPVAQGPGLAANLAPPFLLLGFQRLHRFDVVVVVGKRSEHACRIEVVLRGDRERVFPAVHDATLDIEDGDAGPPDTRLAGPNRIVGNDARHGRTNALVVLTPRWRNRVDAKSIYGRGQQRKPFISLEDAVEGLARLALNDADGRPAEHVVYNQVTRTISIVEIAETIAEVAQEHGLDTEVTHVENPRDEDKTHKMGVEKDQYMDLIGSQRVDFEGGVRSSTAYVPPASEAVCTPSRLPFGMSPAPTSVST